MQHLPAVFGVMVAIAFGWGHALLSPAHAARIVFLHGVPSRLWFPSRHTLGAQWHALPCGFLTGMAIEQLPKHAHHQAFR